MFAQWSKARTFEGLIHRNKKYVRGLSQSSPHMCVPHRGDAADKHRIVALNDLGLLTDNYCPAQKTDSLETTSYISFYIKNDNKILPKLRSYLQAAPVIYSWVNNLTSESDHNIPHELKEREPRFCIERVKKGESWVNQGHLWESREPVNHHFGAKWSDDILEDTTHFWISTPNIGDTEGANIAWMLFIEFCLKKMFSDLMVSLKLPQPESS